MHTCKMPEILYTSVSQSAIGVNIAVMRWYDLFQFTVYSEKTSDLCCQPLAEIESERLQISLIQVGQDTGEFSLITLTHSSISHDGKI